MTLTECVLGARAYANDNGMICKGLDFSYLGIHGLWQHDLGKIYVSFHRLGSATNVTAWKALIQRFVQLMTTPMGVLTLLRPSKRWLGSFSCLVSSHKDQTLNSPNSVNSAFSAAAQPSLPQSLRRSQRAWCAEANETRRPRWQSSMETQVLLVVRC